MDEPRTSEHILDPSQERQSGQAVHDDYVSAEVDWIDLGYITKPHGLQGELRVFMFNPQSTLFEAGSNGPLRELFLRTASGLRVKWGVAGFRRHKELYLLRLAGVTSRDEAEALRGQHLTLPRAALPALEEDDEFYAVDLERCRVIDETGCVVGRVVGVLNYPSVDCLAVELAPDQIEVPMVEPYLRGVDIARKEIRVSGLRDLPRVKAPAPKSPSMLRPTAKSAGDSLQGHAEDHAKPAETSLGAPPSSATETEGV